MGDANDDESITLELTRNEALVMLEWLDRMDEPGDRSHLRPFDAATLRLRNDLECMLEAAHPDVFAPDYQERLQTAVDDVRDDWSADG